MLDYKYEISDYIHWLQKVCKYALKEYEAEIKVTNNNQFSYSYGNKTIEISSDSAPRDKLYILLHEVGHVSRMLENEQDSTYFMDRSGSRNKNEKTMVLMEEILAWHKAEQIAERLSIPIEKNAWQRLVNKSTQKYIDWVNKQEDNTNEKSR